MSGLARVLKNLGFEVTGSDIASSELTRTLEALGIRITYNHRASNIQDAEVVVYSSAIGQENPELVAAHKQMIPVIPRAEMLSELMRMKYAIAVAGAHGKTTTASLITAILDRCGLDPTSVIGGRIQGPETNAHLGQSEYLVAEADESDRSFLILLPTLAVITSIDEEHMDRYKDIFEIQRAFIEFANRVPFYGAVIANFDDPRVREIIPEIERRVITYGTRSDSRVRATGLELGPKTHFVVQEGNKILGEVVMPLPGLHNLHNALAGIAAACELALPFVRVAQAVQDFAGVHRRLETIGERAGILVVDDYGHHPTEIQATLEALRLKYPERRLVVVFQPHRYTRTQALYSKFGRVFAQADHLFLLPIYPAGERAIPGVSTELILEVVKAQDLHKSGIEYASSGDEVVARLREILTSGDLVLTLGAGDVWKIGQKLLAEL
jgi:UDP-N-acetylmuramate--alanine ligase